MNHNVLQEPSIALSSETADIAVEGIASDLSFEPVINILVWQAATVCRFPAAPFLECFIDPSGAKLDFMARIWVA